MRMKAKLRECEESRSVFLEMDLSRGKECKNNEAERRDNTEREVSQLCGRM